METWFEVLCGEKGMKRQHDLGEYSNELGNGNLVRSLYSLRPLSHQELTMQFTKVSLHKKDVSLL